MAKVTRKALRLNLKRFHQRRKGLERLIKRAEANRREASRLRVSHSTRKTMDRHIGELKNELRWVQKMEVSSKRALADEAE
jgi:hypothetical protein